MAKRGVLRLRLQALARRAARAGRGAAATLAVVACCSSLSSCGGLAGDDERDAPTPGEGPPEEAAPVLESCEENPLLSGCGPPSELPAPESCEDNPLLEQCRAPAHVSVATTCANNPLILGCPSQSEELPDDLLSPSTRAQNVLATYCGGCHGPAAAVRAPGPRDITDLGMLAQEGYITDCSAARSWLVIALGSQDMGGLGDGTPLLPDRDVALVVQGIEADCTPEQLSCAGDPAQPGCQEVRVELMLERRCGSCHGAAARSEASATGSDTALPMYFDDVSQMLAGGQIVACDAERSPLLVRALDGRMPPASSGRGYALGERDVGLLREFIRNGVCPDEP